MRRRHCLTWERGLTHDKCLTITQELAEDRPYLHDPASMVASLCDNTFNCVYAAVSSRRDPPESALGGRTTRTGKNTAATPSIADVGDSVQNTGQDSDAMAQKRHEVTDARWKRPPHHQECVIPVQILVAFMCARC